MRRLLFISAAALLAASIVGCRPKAAPAGPGTKPAKDPEAAPQLERTLPAPAREVVIGEMCPAAAGGRPAVLPVFARKLAWLSGDDDVATPIRSNGVRQFSVYGWTGDRAGVFSVAGSAEVGLERPAAIGAYAGRSPCVVRTDGDAEGVADPVCVAAQTNCGLAVAPLEAGGGFGSRPYGEDPDPFALRTTGACVVGGKLVVDIDGDGVDESFPTASFLGPVRAPADEVSAVPGTKVDCKRAFSLRHVLPPTDPKHWRGLDLLGAVDIDGDGRFELVLSYHYSDRRTWAVYTARSGSGRLELAGEAMPWPRP